MHIKSEEVKININTYSVSAQLLIPEDYEQSVIIANGAGADMKNAFIGHYCKKLAENGFMSIKFNFHYQEIGRRIPDKNEKCQETYLGVIHFLKENYISENKIIIGGKSMGGRIATQIADRVECPKLVIFGYPLHPPGKPEKLRDTHLYPIQQKVLIIQGENDAFGTRTELEPVVRKMKQASAFFVPQGNHSLKVAKKSGLDNAELQEKILEKVVRFIKRGSVKIT